MAPSPPSASHNLEDLVELDGTTLEGGGQLLRIAICLSALTSTPIKIYNIRGKRSSGGGLKAQHLACVDWLAHASNAFVEGAEKGSKELLFVPWCARDASGVLRRHSHDALSGHELQNSPAFRKVRSEGGEQLYSCNISIGTAGSTGLALQAILPFILFRHPGRDSGTPVRLVLSGGTNVSGSPSYEYISQVLLPMLESIGLSKIRPSLGRRGWSHGGSSIGTFALDIPAPERLPLPGFNLRPSDDSVKPPKPGKINATFLGPASIFEHLRELLTSAVQHHFGSAYTEDASTLEISLEDSRHEKRLYLIMVAVLPGSSSSDSEHTYRLGRDWLYDRKIRSHAFAATEMAERVTDELAKEWRSGARVDEHMRDQLVIFEALAQGRSRVWPGVDQDSEVREPSLHARTAEWVAREVLGRQVRFDEENGCQGVGYGCSSATEPEAGELDERTAGLSLKD